MTDRPQDQPRVLQMRLVVEADDYDEAVRFYRDVLGGREELQVHGADGEKVTILDVGRATLELSNHAQVEMIDRVEVGRRVSPGCASRSRSPTPRPRPSACWTAARSWSLRRRVRRGTRSTRAWRHPRACS